MPCYKDKRTGRLFIQFQLKGVTYKERLPAGTTKTDARKIESKWRSDLLFRSHGITEQSEMLYEDWLITFGEYALSNYSATTYQKTLYVCAASLPFLKGKPLRAIRQADIERFKTARANLPTIHGKKRKPATVLRELSILSKVFSLAVKNDLCDYNPVSRVEKPKFDNVQNRILSREDEAKLFAHIHGDWTRDVCLMALYTGLRQNDILRLERCHVDWANNSIRLIQGKTQRIVEVKMNDIVRSVLKSRWEGDRHFFLSPKTGRVGGSVRHSLHRAADRAGIPRITIRDLRRTCGSRLEDAGFNSATIAKQLGHGDLRSVHRYQRSGEIMQKAADSLVKSAPNLPAAVGAAIPSGRK